MEWVKLHVVRHFRIQVKTETIESNRFQTPLQYLAELRKVITRIQNVSSPANVYAIRDHVTLIQCTIGHAAEFQEFVIAQLPDTKQHTNPNHHQYCCSNNTARIE